MRALQPPGAAPAGSLPPPALCSEAAGDRDLGGGLCFPRSLVRAEAPGALQTSPPGESVPDARSVPWCTHDCGHLLRMWTAVWDL